MQNLSLIQLSNFGPFGNWAVSSNMAALAELLHAPLTQIFYAKRSQNYT